MRPLLAFFPLRDLELQPVATDVTVDTAVKVQQEFQRVVSTLFCHPLPYPHMISIHGLEPWSQSKSATPARSRGRKRETSSDGSEPRRWMVDGVLSFHFIPSVRRCSRTSS